MTEIEWKAQFRESIIEALDKFLEVSESGGWGVKYQHPVVERYEDGTTIYNKGEITAVDFYVQFSFENPLKIIGA